MNDLYIRHLLRGAGVEGYEGCVESVRTQHRAKHHSGTHNVRRELMFAGDKVAAVGLGDRRAGDLPICRRREWRITGDALHQRFAAREFAIGERLRTIGRGNFPSGGDQF